ncbi:MAG: 3-deoxy-manno-octulosonate cytidylyltransferase [Thermoguttaceae bacterium]|nr:3-deoxy-manno-octulosonate cytidylyltransferase [Thermoguttaceae bacterium]
MRTLIVIPARYNSKRFPGKPLAMLAGKPILQRVWDIADSVCHSIADCSAIVATETPSENCHSERIVDFCRQRQIPVALTSNECRSGSDRVFEVARRHFPSADIVVNLQGDVPTCPPYFLNKLIKSLQDSPQASVASVYTSLSWDSLDQLRESKKKAPFSGTTVITNKDDMALWFSKTIIPAIRNEQDFRSTNPTQSPVKRHIGLYAYRFEALKFFATTSPGVYESLEQLEQLRFLENGYQIKMSEVAYPQGYEQLTSGIDSPDDLARAERIINEYGEII